MDLVDCPRCGATSQLSRSVNDREQRCGGCRGFFQYATEWGDGRSGWRLFRTQEGGFLGRADLRSAGAPESSGLDEQPGGGVEMRGSGPPPHYSEPAESQPVTFLEKPGCQMCGAMPRRGASFCSECSAELPLWPHSSLEDDAQRSTLGIFWQGFKEGTFGSEAEYERTKRKEAPGCALGLVGITLAALLVVTVLAIVLPPLGIPLFVGMAILIGVKNAIRNSR